MIDEHERCRQIDRISWLIVIAIAALFLVLAVTCTHAAEFSAFARPALVQTAVDFREVVTWNQRTPTVDFGVSAVVKERLSVGIVGSLTSQTNDLTVMVPEQLVVGASTFGQKGSASQSQFTELAIQSQSTNLRIEAVPYLLRGPLQPLIMGERYDLWIQATGKDESNKVVTAEERITRFLPAIGAQMHYPLAYTVCDLKAALGPRLTFIEGSVVGRVVPGLSLGAGAWWRNVRGDDVKLTTQALFAQIGVEF